MTDQDGDNIHFVEHLHISVMPMWAFDALLRCENPTCCQSFLARSLSSETVFSFCLCMYSLQAVQHEMYALIWHI